MNDNEKTGPFTGSPPEPCSPVLAVLKRLQIGERIQRGDWWYSRYIECWLPIEKPPRNWLGRRQKITRQHAPFYRVTVLQSLPESTVEMLKEQAAGAGGENPEAIGDTEVDAPAASEEPKKRFWASWVQPTDDHRPLKFPPTEPIIGWWCSGYDSDDNATLVALIEAEDEQAAADVVKENWPEWSEWRFIEPRPIDYRPGDRFPLNEWMLKRI